MIRYSCIIAAFLIYSRSTNAGELFELDDKLIMSDLREEGGESVIGNALSFGKGKDILCDRLTNDEKQAVCDKIMLKLISKHYGRVFRSFTYTDPSPPFSRIDRSWNPFKCELRTIAELNTKKRMMWCNSRQFDKMYSDDCGEMRGFFCAGSRKTNGRVFALRALTWGSEKLSPILEMDNTAEILQYVPASSSHWMDADTLIEETEE